MKQYVFFDPDTDQIRHTHMVVSAETGKSIEVDDEQLEQLVARMVDAKRLNRIYAAVPSASGRSHELHVDRKRKRVTSRRIPVRDRTRRPSNEES